MNEDYDVIVMGAGLKECILSGLLSVKGTKVSSSAKAAIHKVPASASPTISQSTPSTLMRSAPSTV